MPTTESITPADILSRVQFPDPAALCGNEAAYILQIRFSERDLARIRDLLAKNREGGIGPREKEELNNFLSISYFLDILHSKARVALERAGPSGTAA